MSRVYFKNLNGLRFIAASLVVVHHIEQFKLLLGHENYFSNPFIHSIGKYAVVLFFVLSGFLITYLLLAEKEQYKFIDIKKFYARRILRIWPLYYLIFVIAFFVLPQFDFFAIDSIQFKMEETYSSNLLYFLFFLPNVALGLFSPVPYAAQSWSIGVEEQFYLLWPLLLAKFSNPIKTISIVAVVYFLLKVTGKSFFGSDFRNILKLTPIDCLSLGGIFAVLYRKNSVHLQKMTQSRCFQWLIVILIVFVLFLGKNVNTFIRWEIYAILSCYLIVALIGSKSIFNMENSLFNYLGKISYGIYMFHPIAIMVSYKLVNSLLGFNNYFLYLASFALTCLMASGSYELYEKHFLRIKNFKWSKIKTG